MAALVWRLSTVQSGGKPLGPTVHKDVSKGLIFPSTKWCSLHGPYTRGRSSVPYEVVYLLSQGLQHYRRLSWFRSPDICN